MGDVPIPLPPTAEQRAIADFLDRETAKIDALIERLIGNIETGTGNGKLSGLVALLRERRTALITAAVTGQIDVSRPAMPEAAA